MSSSKFETIFDGAASIVESRYRGMVGVRTVLDDIKSRGQFPVKDVLSNRKLIIEPWIVSQSLRVPLETVKSVASELQKLNVLHLWVRVHCPSVDEEDDDDVILETSDPKQFKQKLAEPCPFCGQFHDSISSENLDTFYAIHFDDEPDDFSIGRFITKKAPKIASRGVGSVVESEETTIKEKSAFNIILTTNPDITAALNRLLVVFHLGSRESHSTSPIENVSQALATNERATIVPSVNEVVSKLWFWSIVSFCSVMLLCVILYFIVPIYVVVSLLAAYFLLYAMCCNYTLKAFFSSTYLPKQVATYSFGLAGILLATSRFDIDTGIGQNVPWHLSLRSGNVSVFNMCGAVALTIVGVIGMIYLQPSKN